MTTNTETTTPAPALRVGEAVLYGDSVYTVLETRTDGVLIESIDRSRTQTFVPASRVLHRAP